MWNGKKKALTFSYDDGHDTDRRLAELLDKYGMKCTFNLNGGHLVTRENLGAPKKLYTGPAWKNPDALVNQMPIEEMLEVYKNHEIAVHAYTHPNLNKLTREECNDQIAKDIEKLTEIFGKTPVGMAYPFGAYNDTVVDVLREHGLRYARTTRQTLNFDIQTDLLRFHPTCHHGNEQLMELAKKFVEMETDEPQLFYVWGHAYEFEGMENWDVIERFCDLLANRDDIFYGTNAEVLL